VLEAVDDIDPMSPKQIQSIVQADARVNLYTGSISGGKTVASLLRWLIYVATAPPGELVVIGRTRQSIARNVFGPLADVSLFGPLAMHSTYTAGADTAKILGRTIHVMGASDARSEMVLRGLTCAGAYVDELTLVTEDFWVQLLGRLRVPGAQIFATTNPDAPAHFVKRQIIDRAVELGYRVFRFRMSDNEHLDPTYVAQVSREYVGLWRRRFIDGDWVIAAGAIYSQWEPARHVADPSMFPAMTRILDIGIDYGDTPEHPTRGYLLGLGPDTRPGQVNGHRLYILAEWAPGYMTIGEYSTSLRAWLASQPEAWRNPDWVAVDPAAQSFRHQLSFDGMHNTRNAHNSVLPGIRTMAALLATDRLVVADTCTELIDEIPGYVWDSKAAARGEDKPVKAKDDCCDSARYAIQTSRMDWRDLIPLAPALSGAPGEDDE
jgi:phage terminase large subunit-like protein